MIGNENVVQRSANGERAVGLLRQAEKRRHRWACALRGCKAVSSGSGLSVSGNVSVLQRPAKGERAVGPAVASEANDTPWSFEGQRLVFDSLQRAEKRRCCLLT